MKTLPRIACVLFCFCSISPVLHAQIPQLINYQGRVVVGTTNFNGSGQFKFALVNAAGTTTYWSNDGTSASGSEPTNAVTLTVTNGLYSVQLGDNSITNMTALPGSVFTNSDVRLRVWFNDGTNGSQVLTPDQRIAAVGYAFMADNIKDGAITSAKLGTGAVGAANIANGAVGTTQLGSGAVTNANIGSGAVGTAQLQAGLTLAGTTTGTFSGPLSGNASTATSATSAATAGSATNFTGSLAGDVTGTQSATSIAATTVTGKALTGFSSSAGTVSATDTVLVGINKLDGNIAVKAPLASPSFTGTVSAPAVNIPTTTTATNGVIEMNGTPILSAKGTSNFFLASGAGNFTLTNNENTGAGANALHGLTSGTANSAFGAFALNHNTQGLYNTGLGDSALSTNTLGNSNTAVGYSALFANAGGGGNTAVGWQALETNTSGSNNTAVGLSALTNATGSTNIAIGLNAGQSVTTGSNNIDIGNDGAAESNTIRIGTTQTDTFLTGVIHGNGSGLTGISSFSGSLAGDVTGTQSATIVASVGGVSAANVASGANLANAATNAGTASAIVKRDASGNFSAGTITASLAGNASTATNATTAGTATNFSGSLAGDVTGTQGATAVASVGGVSAANVASGANLANAATSANTASAIVKRDTFGNFITGAITIMGSTSIAHNIFLPSTTDTNTGVIKMNSQTILSAFGTENLFLGTNAGNFTLTGSDNTAVGYQTLLSNTTGSQNTAVGAWSLEPNQAGGSNTAVGYFSLVSNNFGNGNTAVGSQALQNNSNGSNNTAVGIDALFNATGSGNIGLGGNAGTNITSGSNNIDIGNSGGAESNTIRIGTPGTQTATFIAGISGATASGGVAVLVNSNGQLGTLTSSRRFKTDIKPMDDASSVLLSLRPVIFHYKPEIDPKAILQFGLIAEEVAEVCPDLVIRDEKGEIQTVRYEQVNAMLLNEFLKQHRRIAELEKEQQTQLDALREENAALRAENTANAKRLAALETRDKERDVQLARIEESVAPPRTVALQASGSEQ